MDRNEETNSQAETTEPTSLLNALEKEGRLQIIFVWKRKASQSTWLGGFLVCPNLHSWTFPTVGTTSREKNTTGGIKR